MATTNVPSTDMGTASKSEEGLLYSAGSLKVIDEFQDGIGMILRRFAKARALADGRNLVTAEDVGAVLKEAFARTEDGQDG